MATAPRSPRSSAASRNPTRCFTISKRVIRTYRLPLGLFRDLVDAFQQDVTKKRYASFAELSDYCRRSANPVGRLLLALFKRTTEADLAASDAICSALQLINFWQDVDIDYTPRPAHLSSTG